MNKACPAANAPQFRAASDQEADHVIGDVLRVMPKTKVAILGAGFWALDNHVPALKARDDAELVGICRLGTAELRAAQQAHGVPFASENYEELFSLPGLEGVIVASPHHLHFEHARAALERGLHVMCEKPMTLNVRDARTLAEIAATRKLHFLVPYGWNYTGFAANARRLVKEGAIGQVEHVLCHMASSLRDLFSGQDVTWADNALFPPERNTWSDPLTGGGFAHGQLTHALALLLWISELKPAEIFTFARNSLTGADLYDAISCRFTNGATGMLGGAATMPLDAIYQVDIRLFGSDGMLLLDIERPRLELKRNDGNHQVIPVTEAPGEYTCIRPVHRFLDLIQGRSDENCSTADLGADVVALLDGASRSAASGRVQAIERND
jgi:predicted dehydrogenase